MIDNVLASIAGVERYGIISLVLFLIVFIVMVVRTMAIDREEIKRYSLIPLDDGQTGERIKPDSSGETGLSEGVDL